MVQQGCQLGQLIGSPIELVLARLPDHSSAGKDQWSARCPAHEDRRESLSIGVGDDGKVLLCCHAGCKLEEITAAIGLTVADLMPPRAAGNGKARRGEIAKTYNYLDENHQLVFQVCRMEPKDFRQRKPTPGGGWAWSVKGLPKLPYRLPELLAEPQRPVAVVEGEKDVDNLRRIGVLATCNPGGAGKWTTEHAAFLRGRAVVILPDNDQPGRDHAQQVARSLVGVAESIRMVKLPGLAPKGDVSDWLAAGGTKADLLKLIESAAEWQPADAQVSPPPTEPPAGDGIDVGDWVIALDRGNRGEVIGRHGSHFEVRFVNPDSGDTATKEFERKEIRKIGSGGESGETSLPPVQTLAAMLTACPQLRPIVIHGVARRGETINVIAAPKAGKSWLGYGAAFAVATGGEWVSFRCEQGRVLLIDNELHPETLAHRLRIVAEALWVADGWQDQIDVLPLRGRLVDLYSLGDAIRAIARDTYRLVIADAFYRFLPQGVDENSNAQMALLYNQIDAYAEHLGAVWLNIHHASKGDQSQKAVTDVGAGAGAQSRAADAHIVLRPHEEAGVAVLEAAVRSFPPLNPLAVRWDYPLWSHAYDADPARIKQARQGTVDPSADAEKILTTMEKIGPETKSAIRDSSGIRSERFKPAFARLLMEQKIEVCEITKANRKAPYEAYRLTGGPSPDGSYTDTQDTTDTYQDKTASAQG